MNKIRFIIFACIFWIAGIVNAQQQVSKEEAINAAINTLRSKTDILKVSQDEKIKIVNSLSNTNEDTIMYEVVFQNGVAVLLSGSKTCLPVLGYYVKEDNGDVFDPNNDNVPCGLKALLDDYVDDIEWGFAQDTICLQHKEKWQELQQSSLHKSAAPPFIHVAPLLTTRWGQQWANDGACPAYNYYVTKTSANQCGDENCGNLCPIGCTGVAMGQIMKYWNYPVYQPNKAQQYDWCNMSDELNQSSPNYTKERNAIARLLKDCADAANAHYCIAKCNTSATAIAARKGLINDFGYNSNAVFRLRSSHPINQNNVWIDYLKTNLNAGRPVLYGALGVDAHYWVCDGYGDDGNGNSHENVYFHFNFGHRGNHDGWYTVNNITANSHWNNLQEAVFNIYPDNTQDYCNFTWPLAFHYNYWNLQGFPVPLAHLFIPKTFSTLESVSETFPASWRTIESGQVAEYVAHEEIKLLPGFHAKAGSNFVARIEPCDGCGSASRSMLSSNVEDYTYEFSNLKSFNDSILQKLDKNNLGKDILNKDITLFPNPNTGSFTIQTNNFDNIKQIQVINPLGQTIYTVQYPTNNNITLPNGAKGTYFVRITTETESVTRKILVE